MSINGWCVIEEAEVRTNQENFNDIKENMEKLVESTINNIARTEQNTNELNKISIGLHNNEQTNNKILILLEKINEKIDNQQDIIEINKNKLEQINQSFLSFENNYKRI